MNPLGGATLRSFALIDLATQQPFPANRIPDSRFSIQMGVDTSFRGGSVPVFPDPAGPLKTLDIRQSNGICLVPGNFAAPAFGTLGSLARNAFHGPAINNFDLGIVRNFSIRERFKAQIRAELFNAFNHAQFVFGGASLASSIAAPPPGETQPVLQIRGSFTVRTRPARIVQFAAKWIW